MLEALKDIQKPDHAIYLDHAATTPVDPEVLTTMLPYFSTAYGNPGGLYEQGRTALQALDAARNTIARICNAKPTEIIFTGSGTESDNMAIFGIARQHQNTGRHILTTPFEHHAVLEPCLELSKKEGFEVQFLPLDGDGLVRPEDVLNALREDTILISIMSANNEIGTIEPIAEIGNTIRKWKKARGRKPFDPPFFHTDACQAAGACDLNVEKLHVDALTINGSKIYGPKGVGVLYLKNGVSIRPILYGGGQEFKKRSGTENVPLIVGLATALEIAQKNKEQENTHLTELRDYFTSRLLKEIPKVVLNGHPSLRLPNNINVSILDIEGEALLLYLDAYRISVSTGSACTSQSLDPSHVILAIGKPYEFAHGSIRFTLGKTTTKEDLNYAMQILIPVVERLRQISPVNIDMKKICDSNLAKAFLEDGLPHFVKKQKTNSKMIYR